MTRESDSATDEDRPLELRVAGMLRVGTAAASLLLCLGTVLMYLRADRAATILLAGGCGLLALLPVIRLAMMAGHFTRLAQPRLVLATLVVLALVVASGVVGMVG